MVRTAPTPSALSTAARPGSSRLRLAPTSDFLFPEVDGTSIAVTVLKAHIGRVARDPFVSVLIRGESGTGKERVASAIHSSSLRHDAPFVAVNCAGLAPNLVEDELFGHVRGAFTGATGDRPGPFERAAGGTVFLDEIGELAPEAQIKLLRALQQRRVQRLGGDREVAFDARIIAATNVDLTAAVARGQFRDDLYYRLKVYEIYVPPLRERGAMDLRILVDSILGRHAERRQRSVPMLDASVFKLFVRYQWPGNVRQLENTLERMLVAADGEPILTTAHLPDDFESSGSPTTHSSDEPLQVAQPTLAEVGAALERNAMHYGRAAAALGLSRHQLYRLRKRSAPDPNRHP